MYIFAQCITCDKVSYSSYHLTQSNANNSSQFIIMCCALCTASRRQHFCWLFWCEFIAAEKLVRKNLYARNEHFSSVLRLFYVRTESSPCLFRRFHMRFHLHQNEISRAKTLTLCDTISTCCPPFSDASSRLNWTHLIFKCMLACHVIVFRGCARWRRIIWSRCHLQWTTFPCLCGIRAVFLPKWNYAAHLRSVVTERPIYS